MATTTVEASAFVEWYDNREGAQVWQELCDLLAEWGAEPTQAPSKGWMGYNPQLDKAEGELSFRFRHDIPQMGIGRVFLAQMREVVRVKNLNWDINAEWEDED